MAWGRPTLDIGHRPYRLQSAYDSLLLGTLIDLQSMIVDRAIGRSQLDVHGSQFTAIENRVLSKIR